MSNIVASVGQNSSFIAFMAHAGFAYGIVLSVWAPAHQFRPTLLAALFALIAAAIKEFWFDAKYEKNPPQTWQDNLQDFVGYASGILAALAMAFWIL